MSNEIRHDCKGGANCWLEHCHVRMEILGEALPGSCDFMDIDFATEIGGHFLFGEWKKPDEKLKGGPGIMLKGLSRLPQSTVAVVRGYQQTMEIESVQFVQNGVYGDPIGANLPKFQRWLKKWGARAWKDRLHLINNRA